MSEPEEERSTFYFTGNGYIERILILGFSVVHFANEFY